MYPTRPRSRVEEGQRSVAVAVTSLARRLYGRATRDAVERTTCGVIDLPQGAIRRHLIAGIEIPR